MGKEGILGDAHGIDDAAGAIVRLAAMMGVCVAEHNFHAAAADAPARAGPLEPVFVPALDHLAGKLIHVVIVLQGGGATIERAVALLVKGIGLLVPVFAQPLVPTVFHGPHRLAGALVDVEHLAAVFCLADVEHLAAAYGTAAKGVVLVADGLQLEHVLAADALIASLVEDDAGVVAVVDDGIAHQLHALLPTGALHIFFGIAGRHGLEKSHAVARFHILLPGGDMHPANQIAARLYHQSVAVVAEPGRHAQSHARPLVAGALGIAVHHHHAVVEVEHAILERCLAKAGTCDDGVVEGDETAVVDHFPQPRLNGIEIAVAPAPEMQIGHTGRCLQRPRLTRAQIHGLHVPGSGYHVAVGIAHAEHKGHAMRLTVVVAHLRLHMDGGLMAGNVEVGGIDVGARRAEVGVERQRLIDLVRKVQVDVLGNAAIVGIEIAVVPLVAAVVNPRAIRPAVVTAHGQHVLALMDVGGKVEAAGHDTILREAQAVTIQPEVGTLAHALELYEHLALHFRGRKLEMLPIPGYGVGEVDNILAEGLVAIEGKWKGDLLPAGIVKRGLGGCREIANTKKPAGIEAEFLPLGSM